MGIRCVQRHVSTTSSLYLWFHLYPYNINNDSSCGSPFLKSKATLSNTSYSFSAENLGTIQQACLNIQAVPPVNKAYNNCSLYKQNADGYTIFYIQWQASVLRSTLLVYTESLLNSLIHRKVAEQTR